jgi:heme oxygenase
MPGEYTFIFSNLDSAESRTCNLALHTFEDMKEQIQYKFDYRGNYEVVYDPSQDEFEEEVELAGDEDIANVRGYLKSAYKHV